jgi:hypothetical protein
VPSGMHWVPARSSSGYEPPTERSQLRTAAINGGGVCQFLSPEAAEDLYVGFHSIPGRCRGTTSQWNSA